MFALMQSSVARMTALIGDVLDLARGRMGGRHQIETRPPGAAAASARTSDCRNPRRVSRIDWWSRRFDLTEPVDWRPWPESRSFFSNLIGNAVTHGDAGAPITVRGQHRRRGPSGYRSQIQASKSRRSRRNGCFSPSPEAPPTAIRRASDLVFTSHPRLQRPHGGMLTVSSSPEETRFVFQMPLQ